MSASLLSGSISIQVVDKGDGIHPKDLPHIFERFYQSKQAYQTAQGGTGIGLALAHKLAALMEGNLTAISELNVGYRFTLMFPAKIITQDFHLPLTSVEYNGILEKDADFDTLPNNLGVLVVEDNDDMRDFLVDILTPLYNVRAVGNGLKALEYLNEHSDTIDLRFFDSFCQN